jgi:hypothetical protein
MPRVCAHGIVKNGQVVLTEPLALPDGTPVTVADGTPDESERHTLLTALNRLDLIDDPDWRAKAEPDRIAYTEAIIREIAGMWAGRPEMADPEQWVRRQRGARE